MGTAVAEGTTIDASPYVPRLLGEWLRDTPDRRWKQVDATLVFVDLSGFTSLSERLGRAGNIGAEELTDTINACFAALLQVAYEAGGSLVKFGGDALLLLYSGTGHAAMACRAAFGMREGLRRLGALETSAGPVNLEMSIGIHTGELSLFLVGGSHRELVVTGPVATETVTMEAAAEAGQIVISPSTTARVDGDVVGARVGPGYLLDAAPDLSTAVETPSVGKAGATLVEAALPPALREHLAAERRDAEHRHVSVAFLRFSGTDDVLLAEGPDAAADALDGLIRAVQEGADRHGVTFLGTDIDAGGGKVLLTAGAPASRGNDEERMLLALRDIVEQPTRIALQVGVHAGSVFAGEIGPHYRRSYTVMGDAVNLAARVMGRSIPRAILATDEVLSRSRTTFEADPLVPFMVKGKRDPVRASRVGAVLGSRSRDSVGELPFVGREAELATLDAVLAEAAGGSGQLVDVVGEAGIGKSRLLAALRARAGDWTVVEVVCELYRSTLPYGTIRKLLHDQLGAPPEASSDQAAEHLLQFLRTELPHLEEWAPLLAVAYGTSLPSTPATANLEEQFLRPRLQELVLEVLDRVWQGPVLVTIEDAQWLDEASADVLHAIASKLDDRPWVVCVSRREEDPRPTDQAATTTLELQPLDAESVATLASAATEATPLAPHEMTRLIERSGGNPLFLEELVTAARETGSTASLPGSIDSVVTARIDRLPASSRNMLREASVLGYRFPRDLAAAVLTSGDPVELTQLPDFLVVEGEHIRFQHSMIRDAAYAGLPYRRRRSLHALVGDTIAAGGGDRYELLSFHYHLAERHVDAWHASLAAGKRAAAVYANAEAAGFYERALDAARRLRDLDPTEVAEASEALGDALQRMGEIERAGAAYRAASRALRGHTIAWSRVLLKSAQIKAQLDRYSQALAAITRGLTRLEGLDDPVARSQRAQLMVWYGHLRLEQGRSADAIRWCRRAIEEAEAVDDRDALAHAYRLLDWGYVDQGRPDLAVYSTRALELYEELGDLPNQASVLNNLGGIAYWSGDWTEALQYFERANELNERVGDVIRAALGRNNIAEILADQGRWEEADRLFRTVERSLRAASFRVAVAYVRANMGRTAARAGRFDEAEELLEEARQGAYEAGAASQMVESEARLAEMHVLRGQPDQALRAVDSALQRSDAKEGVTAQEPLIHRVRGYALLQLGELDRAAADLRQSLEAAQARDADYERALAAKALVDHAEVAGVEPDPQLLEASRQTFEALGVERLPAIPLTRTGALA